MRDKFYIILLVSGMVLSAFGDIEIADKALPLALSDLDARDEALYQRHYLAYMSGVSAQRHGFASIADLIFRNLISEPDVDKELLKNARYGLAMTLLNRGRVRDAERLLDADQAKDHPSHQFLRLLVAYHSNAPISEIKDKLEALAPVDLGKNQLWVETIHSVVLARSGDQRGSRAALDRALAMSVNTFQRDWVELLFWREEILRGEASEAMAITLKSQLDNAVNPIVASQLVQQYAMVLSRLERQTEAIQAVEAQIAVLSSEFREQKDRLLVFLAILSGPGTGRARLALESVLTQGVSERMRSMALHYRLSTTDFRSEAEAEFFRGLLRARSEDPLRNQMDFALALSAYFRGDFDESQAKVQRILASDADADTQQSALRVMVALSWSLSPPQYRVAAEHLQRLRGLLGDTKESAQMTMLAADSYFLNRDFANAIPFYEQLVNRAELSEQQQAIVYRLSSAYLRLGNLDATRRILDDHYDANSDTGRLIWGSEWNYHLHLIRLNRYEGAKERLERLDARLREASATDWYPSARLRMAWMQGFLHFQLGDTEQAAAILREVIDEFGSPSAEMAQQERVLKDEVKLLQARILFRTGNVEDARALIEQIHETGNLETAASSHIIEARHWLSVGDRSTAQRVLLRLAERYPQSDFAPIALYEAALNLESRGDEGSDQQAVRLYDRIARDFPQHPLHFIARLRQGDLLRKSNQFAAAVPFYENMLNEFAGDARVHLVEIALGESYLALGTSRSDYTDQAVRIFERLFDLSHLPAELRIEAATKAATGLAKVGRNYRAQDLLWRVVSLVHRDPETAATLGASGKYWLARASLMLGDYLRASGEASEIRRLQQMTEGLELPGVNLMR